MSAMLREAGLLKQLKEQAETHARELRAYEATVQNLEQRIRELEAEFAVPAEPTAEMQVAGAQSIRIATTAVNKLWIANTVWRAMLAAAPQPKKEGE